LARPGGNLLLRRPAQIVTRNNFTSPGQIRDRFAAFQTRYNTVAQPFNWKFTRTDLNALLDRIDAHKVQRSPQLAALSLPPDELTGRDHYAPR
jgi:hypothetical protein